MSRAQRSLRLVGAGGDCAGRLEVYHNGSWGTVCDDSWDLADSQVVCRQLGCGDAVSAAVEASFGPGSGAIWLDEVNCRGSELHLWDCCHSGLNQSDCRHKEDAGVTCTDIFPRNADVRLVNGASPCEGTVEVYHGGEWGTVCDDEWDLDDAAVVCRQLGCGSAVSAPGGAYFGPGSGSVLLSEVSCRESEAALRDCGKDEVKDWGLSHDYDAGDAEVVCRELDCGVPSQVLKGAHFGKGEGQVWTEEFQCQGSESHLFFCPKSSTKTQSCTHENDVGLECFGYTGFRLVSGSDSCSGRVELQYDREWGTVCDLYWDLRDATVLCQQLGYQLSLRLVGAGGDCAGRLEVYHNGSWGTVCDDSWDLADSQVVCRQLQCGMALSAPVPASFSQGTGPIWLDEVGCLGNESSLWECPSAGWGRHDCGHKEDVRILCSDSVPLALRLVGGTNCSGRVELRYEGSWGTVCDDSWDLQDAQVVCRQLGCGDAVSAAIEASFGPGNGAIWLDEVNCTGSELHLWDCCHSGLNQSDCRHKEDAGVTCTE
ncbi:scavenger receptor cysteine-rich type 1 protein M130-like [Lepisosteus oculatus]|uniref:scavenger receptor cysteine-rich type 1 protein M130-like n=1 Tax=Lepisosteus oculatus TaxID=7918 RepID=UPI0035F5134D